jgi:hypothetical protein
VPLFFLESMSFTPVLIPQRMIKYKSMHHPLL